MMPHASLRLRRGAEHLERLKARGIAEFLREVALEHALEDAILDKLDAWRAVSPAALQAAGADSFPPYLTAVPQA